MAVLNAHECVHMKIDMDMFARKEEDITCST
jgi:hypothetical protein